MNNLKRARKANKLTQAQVAEKVGLTQSGYSDWERGETRIDSRSIDQLAKIFDVPVSFIIGTGVFQNWNQVIKYKDAVCGRLAGMIPPDIYLREFSDEKSLLSWFMINTIYSFDEINMIKFFDYAVASVSFSADDVDIDIVLDNRNPANIELKLTKQFEAVLRMHKTPEKKVKIISAAQAADEFLVGLRSKSADAIKVPVLGYVAAGIPIDAIEDIIGWEDISSARYRDGEYFGLVIKGSSMEPKISDGDIVIVRKQSDVNFGETAVVLVNGDEATVKKIKKTPSGVTLVPTNPAYDPVFFTNEEIETLPVTIIGRVVELRAKI